ncbi:DUF1491 family protein [Sneathiella chinensis]|uniref:GTP-binding protein Era n=1 Tax=Sneathiella chinensis TaxID=349750 RepID=A0ABQ5U125_9PROT|nr:DUF1491 family protein [Sneathiella chinensis]GLQ05812.1 hypothetical protein GCM10007924_10330 [Sneathiella chinensis]
MEPKLKAEIWVKAHIRKCAFWNIPVMVVRRGDNSAGTVLIKINRLNGQCMVLTPTTNFEDGSRMWIKGTGADWVDELSADAYIQKQLSFDPDVWVLEIEDREGRHLLDEKIAT